MVHKGLTQNSAPSCYKASPTQQVQAPNIRKSTSILRVTNSFLNCLRDLFLHANTSKSTKWAIKTFESWSEARNRSRPQDPIPVDLLACNDPARLCTHISRFAVETRKANGDPYLPATIHQLLCGLLRYMREISPTCPNFLDKKDSRFKQLHCTLDAYFHKLHSDGIGRQVKHAEVFTKEDEEKLWGTGVLGTNTPACLQATTTSL